MNSVSSNAVYNATNPQAEQAFDWFITNTVTDVQVANHVWSGRVHQLNFSGTFKPDNTYIGNAIIGTIPSGLKPISASASFGVFLEFSIVTTENEALRGFVDNAGNILVFGKDKSPNTYVGFFFAELTWIH